MGGKINTELICEYFDIIYILNNNIPYLKFKLKESKKINTEGIYKTIDKYGRKIPYSSSQYEYFANYLGDNENTKNIYKQRKLLFPKVSALKWYAEVFLKENTEEYNLLTKSIQQINNKVSVSLYKHYSSENGKKTIEKFQKTRLERNVYKKTGEKNKEKWKDPEVRERIIKNRYNENGIYKSKKTLSLRKQDPEYYKKWYNSMLIRNKDPERCKKIGEKAKKMWKEAKENNPKKYFNMLTYRFEKNYSELDYTGKQRLMNYIEHEICLILKDLNVKWLYEDKIIQDKKTYIPDFILPDYNIIIECFGEFWHASPRLFITENDIVFKNITAGMIWKKDKDRIDSYTKAGYKCLFLWEEDIKKNKEYIKSLIRNML